MIESGNRVEAIVKPELLIWARETARFSLAEIAGKLRIKLEKLEDWEKGVSRPTVKQLRRLAQIYKRPLGIFYLPERPIDFQPLRDFRTLPHIREFRQASQLNLEIRRASYRRQVAIDLMEDLYGEIPQFEHEISLSDDPERIGMQIRQILTIKQEEQKDWVDQYEALDRWRLGIEKTGVLVFQSTGLRVEEMRGFSIAEFPVPVVALNIKDSPKGRIFTLLHEFAHIMLKQGAICDVDEHLSRNREEQRIEVFCNHVAGAALIPKRHLLDEDTVIKNVDKTSWSDADLVFLSQRFKASKEVVLRRLLICGKTTEEFYESKRKEFLEEYEKIARRRTTGYVPLYKKIVITAGLTFVRLVLNGYYQERITSSDLSDYLEVRLKHVPRIEDQAVSKSVKLGVVS